jgi:hypothetical protein
MLTVLAVVTFIHQQRSDTVPCGIADLRSETTTISYTRCS